MKFRWSFILFFILSVAQAQTEYQDLPYVSYFRNPYFDSEGYQLGFILDFHVDGIFPWSYEGQLMVGYGTDREALIDPHCLEAETEWTASIKDPIKRDKAIEDAKAQCYIFTNPWPFSTLNRSIYNSYLTLDNARLTPVLVYYVKPFISPEHLITRTKNFVEGIYPLNPGTPIEDSFTVKTEEMPIGLYVHYQSGFVDGRIVKASLDHWLRKSFEVTIQEGPYGNNFRQMSVSSQDLFDFIVKAMLTGRLVRIGYVEILGIENEVLRIGKDYDSAYRVTSVELRKEAAAPAALPGTPSSGK